MSPRTSLDRRRFLGDSATLLGSTALATLLGRDGVLADAPIRPAINPARPHASRSSHFRPRARQVVMIFCSGGFSPLDSFDYKPELVRRHGEPLPGKKLITFQGEQGRLTRPLYPFRPRGESGKMVSTLVDHLGELADEMCFLHSVTTKTNTHGPAENVMSTGFTLDGFPSIGAWISYALGSEADDLPAFVAIPDPRGKPQSSVNNWGPGFLPAAFQGTDFNAARPIRNLARPTSITPAADTATRRFLDALNQKHLDRFPGDSELAARIASYQLAARMQLSVPEITDLSTESRSTVRLYGADSTNPLKAGFARNCLLARRLVERGVRFIQLFNGSYQTGGEGTSNWDGHKKLKVQYDIHGPILDQPAAGLLADLKQRGLLEETLVVFCSEFGRMPTFQKGASGRDHNPDGFTVWMAGAGVRAPFSFGATDPFGHRAVEHPASVHDVHATILHLAGLEHRRLSIYHNGIQRRLTDVHGEVITDVLA
ncbi:MAG: sulfatase [Planctomycetaceae bacterium]|nr:sulfatase [Planctomycetaceae bacterium]